MSNLKELNEIPFETLRGVKEGGIDEKKANSIIGLSNSIINSGKLQLNAYKLANRAQFPELMGLPDLEPSPGENKQLPEPKKGKIRDYSDKHALMLEYAQTLGFKNTAEAMAQLGKYEFQRDYKAWAESLKPLT